MKNNTKKGKPLARKNEQLPPPKPRTQYDDGDFDSTPTVTANPRYLPVKTAVAKAIAQAARRKAAERYVTLGTLSRAIERQDAWLLEFAIRDLESDKVLRFDSYAPAPMKIWAVG